MEGMLGIGDGGLRMKDGGWRKYNGFERGRCCWLSNRSIIVCDEIVLYGCFIFGGGGNIVCVLYIMNVFFGFLR